MASRRVWGVAVLAMLWVLAGFTVLGFVTLCGFWGALPMLLLFVISMSAIWNERQKARQVKLWRLWSGWLIAFVWTLLVLVGRIYTLSGSSPSIMGFLFLIFSPIADGLELTVRDIHLFISIVLLIWSGLELGVATFQYKIQTD